MPVSAVIREWCKRENAATGAYRWMLAFVFSAVACLWGFFVTGSLYVLGALLLSLIVWNVFASKPIQLEGLRSIHCRDSNVRDSLLEMLADSAQVPDWIKAEAARKLEHDGYVTYGFLFDLENEIGSAAERRRAASGAGFKKIMAFGDASERKGLGCD